MYSPNIQSYRRHIDRQFEDFCTHLKNEIQGFLVKEYSFVLTIFSKKGEKWQPISLKDRKFTPLDLEKYRTSNLPEGFEELTHLLGLALPNSPVSTYDSHSYIQEKEYRIQNDYNSIFKECGLFILKYFGETESERYIDNVQIQINGEDSDLNPINKTVTYQFARKCKVCEKLRTTIQKLYRCSNCLFGYYCGEECQKTDWKHHKIHCINTRLPEEPQDPEKELD